MAAESTSSRPSANITTWIKSLKRYVQETDIRTLDLSDMNLQITELSSILKILADSHVDELILTGNDLKNGIISVSKLLIQTQIRNLKLNLCRLSESDVLCLMKILKDTQIADLYLSTTSFRQDDACEFVSYLTESHLTALRLRQFCASGYEESAVGLFLDALPKTSLTHLTLTDCLRKPQHSEIILSLFKSLKDTSIMHLNLNGSSVGRCSLHLLGDSLRDSQLVELNLGDNDINDDGVDALFEALSGSKITSLSLADNSFEGSNRLGRLLRKTKITKLDLSSDGLIQNTEMFNFPHFLTNSSVESLNLNDCGLSDEIGEELMKSLKDTNLTSLYVLRNKFEYKSFAQFTIVVKDTNITEFHFSSNFLMSYGHIINNSRIYSDKLFAGSELERVEISDMHHCGINFFFENLKKLKDSSVSFLRLHNFYLNDTATEALSLSLINTHISHFEISNSKIDFGISNLVSNLKLTAITHLNLTKCGIKDEGVKALAKCLNKTRIIDLDLSSNKITCHGAVTLALFLKSKVGFNLKLKQNQIGDAGLKALAENIQPNLIFLDIRENPGNTRIVERIVWNNRRLVCQLVSLFKKIVPETDSIFQSENFAGITNIDEFLDECLNSYKSVTSQSSAATILAREESITLSSDQISFLLSSFPQQFTSFIASKIEADLSEHVNFLRKVEELGLRQIAECLLLNRPLYTIDEAQGILHPYVYKLLKKYKLPICNLDVEPQGMERIIKYFTTFANIEGATEVMSILEGTNETVEEAENINGFSDAFEKAENS